MKEKNEEKLFALLGEMEQGAVENAIRVDSPEALAAYKKKKARTHPFASPVLRRVTAIAAAFALVVSSLFVLPRLFSSRNYGSAPPPPSFDIVVPDTIESIDMLNYYAALLTLSGRWGRAYDKAVAFTGVSALSDGISESATPTALRVDDKVLYALDPDDVFRVTSIVFFRIRLEDPKGFLASRVGTGIVDVVITENSLEPMITFKNGDRYYSCLINGLSEDSADFSAHKYIEGFHIVKNLAFENNRFMVSFEGENTDASSWKVKSVNVICYGDGNYSDGTLPVIGDTETYKGTLFFTVRDLEDYFASVDV